MKVYSFLKEDMARGNLVLVNPNFQICSAISENCLESYSRKYPDILLQKEANQALQRLLIDISAREKIIPVSGYRTLECQKKIFEDSLEKNGADYTFQYVAIPNASEHQTGLAIDLTTDVLDYDFICPKFPREGIAQIFREVSIKYGFIERYLEEKKGITCIAAEEWHFRYVGVPHAQFITEKKFCLEEYLTFLKDVKQIIFQGYEITYLPYKEGMPSIVLNQDINISGNNMDGFIITRKL